MSTRKGKDGHTPLDPATLDDQVARDVAGRFVDGDLDKTDQRSGRGASRRRRTRGVRTHGSGVSARGKGWRR